MHRNKSFLRIETLAVLALAFLFCLPLAANVPAVDSGVVVFSAKGYFGSGVVVDSNSLITACHVADHGDLVVYAADGQTYEVVRVRKAVTDAARLYVDRPFSVPPMRVNQRPLSLGESAALVGTPLEMRNFNAFMPGNVVKMGLFVRVGERPVYLHYLDAHAGVGVSGGAVVSQGEVVGIAISSYGSWVGFVPATEFQDILR